MTPDPSQITRRLLAALSTCGAEEAGLAGQQDWNGLAALFDRELALLSELAVLRADLPASDPASPEITAQVEALRERYARLQAGMAATHAEQKKEYAGLAEAGRRIRAVAGAYRSAA